MSRLLWQPSPERARGSNMYRFMEKVNHAHGTRFQVYDDLYRWSVDHIPEFWTHVWDFTGIRHSAPYTEVVDDPLKMPGTTWFSGARLNFAENLLRHRDDRAALVFCSEGERHRLLTYAQLYAGVAKTAAALKALGIAPGDRVAGFMPNMPETIIAMLAAASLGAVWSSCSPDFGAKSVLDRFGQIAPRVLFAADGYFFKGKAIDSLPRIREVCGALPGLEKVVIVPYTRPDPEIGGLETAVLFSDFQDPGRQAVGACSMGSENTIESLLEKIYGPDTARQAAGHLNRLMAAFPARPAQKQSFFSEADTILITYGNTLNRPGQAPLATLGEFARTRLKDAFSAVHVLPFFPYSSDDGFSVIDFYRVDPDLGTWDDIAALGRDFDLMVDLVLNHISAQSPWFSRYLAKEPGFEDLAIEARPGEDLMCVVRPRTTPLLTPFTKADGTTVHVWTTFSADQVDLNYCSVSVLEKMVDVLLFYVGQGATFIRLDAVAFLWKKPGTYCIHLEQTHDMVRLFRTVLDRAAPDTVLVTETNVPHAENISYFGHGGDEAQVVYNFTLPPLLLHAFITENTAALTQWAATLELPSDRTTFLNFTASHDGIGVRPLEGILPAAEIDLLVGHTRENGGQVSFRTNPDGTQIPYELNITYLDALGRPGDDDTTRAARLLAALAVQLALPGIPAVYIHTLLGTRNWTDGAKQTGRARTINRRPLDMDDVNQAIDTPGTLRHTLFHAVVDLLRIRRRQPAFHPNAPFDVLFLSSKAFAIKRKCAGQTLFAVTNVSGSPLALLLPIETGSPPMTDLVTGKATPDGALHLKPWQTMWLAARVF